MRDVFVKTDNAARFLTGLEQLSRRGADEACLMVVDGIPGLGKSEVVEWAATQQGWVRLRAKKEWTPSWMLRELLEELRVPPANSFERMYKQALEALSARSQMAQRNGEIFSLVIDEADHIARREQMLETLRDISDFLEMGIPFLPPTSGDRLRGWTTAGTQSRVSITPGRFRKWMNGFVPTRHVEITFGTFGGRTGSSVLIAAWSRSHGKWREDGYGVVHAAAKPH